MAVRRSRYCSGTYDVDYDVQSNCGVASFASRLECIPEPWMCANYPTSNGSDKERCENGNLLENGWEYLYNEGQTFDTPGACGIPGCDCCDRPRVINHFAHSEPIGDFDSYRYSFRFRCVKSKEDNECIFRIFNTNDHSFQRFFLPSEDRSEAEMLRDIQAAKKPEWVMEKKPCNGSILEVPVSTAELASLPAMNMPLSGATNVVEHVILSHYVDLKNLTEDPIVLSPPPVCSEWPFALPSTGFWMYTDCLPDCRPGFVPDVSQWLQDRFIWQPYGCRLQYIDLDEFLTILTDLGIAGIMFFGDSRQLHLHDELYEFLGNKSQMPGEEPPPTVEHSDFGDLPTQFITKGYCRNDFPSRIGNVSLLVASTWGEVEDGELVHCFDGDDLANRKVYLQMRHSLMAKPGLTVINRSMSLLGPDVDLVIWTAGLHNARCSLSNEVILLHLKLEAEVFKQWALNGTRMGLNRTIIYREEIQIYKAYPNPCVSNERLKSINRMAQSVVLQLDRDLSGHALSQPGQRPVRARALYLGAIMEMSSTRLDRLYDYSAHYYPGPHYQNSWKAFPRLVNSEMLLLLITVLKRLAVGIDHTPGLA